MVALIFPALACEKLLTAALLLQPSVTSRMRALLLQVAFSAEKVKTPVTV